MDSNPNERILDKIFDSVESGIKSASDLILAPSPLGNELLAKDLSDLWVVFECREDFSDRHR